MIQYIKFYNWYMYENRFYTIYYIQLVNCFNNFFICFFHISVQISEGSDQLTVQSLSSLLSNHGNMERG